MNDLPQFINNKSTLCLPNNTSIFFTHSNKTEFNSNNRTVFETITTWFNNNYFSLHFEKTHFTHFKTSNSPSIDIKIAFHNKLIPTALSTTFLGLTDSTLSWRMHIGHLTTKLSTACYVIRSIKPLMSHKTLLLIYHSFFHTIKSYRILF